MIDPMIVIGRVVFENENLKIQKTGLTDILKELKSGKLTIEEFEIDDAGVTINRKPPEPEASP